MDLNDDGHGDILSGSYSRLSQPMAGLFQILWGRPDGTFKKAETLKGTDDEPLIIPVADSDPNSDAWIENICTRPTAIDWDGDGDLDLVVGNFPGTFYLFLGEGKGRFSPKPQQLMADKTPLKVEGHHSDPFPIEWDQDGDIDLLSGSNSGGVHWAENVAGKGKMPELKPFAALISPSDSAQPAAAKPVTQSDLKGPGQSTRIWVEDVNSDGKLDLLVGDCVTLVSPAAGVTEAEFAEQSAKWQEAFDAAVRKLTAALDDAKQQNEARQEVSELYGQRSKFMTEDRTGFVWLYIQK